MLLKFRPSGANDIEFFVSLLPKFRPARAKSILYHYCNFSRAIVNKENFTK
jgi:hypothetical protein